MGAVTVTADQERAGAGTEAPDPGRSPRRALVELVVVLSALSAVLQGFDTRTKYVPASATATLANANEAPLAPASAEPFLNH